MAITSFGYAGTVNAPQWARLIPFAGGSTYGVAGNGDWRPAVGGTGDRALTVAQGTGWGHGVMDVSDADTNLNLESVPSGARWDLIVARRVWGSKSTTFQVVKGGPNPALPNRANTPGTSDEQPIALARVVAGSATIAELIDLRVVPGDDGLLAFNELTLSYLNRLGTVIRIGAVRWLRDLDVTRNPVWVKTSPTSLFAAGSTLHGGPFPSSGQPLIQGGTAVAGTNSDAVARVVYPIAFPAGVLSISAVCGDHMVPTRQLVAAGTDKGSTVFQCFDGAGNKVPNSIVRINWIAIGW